MSTPAESSGGRPGAGMAAIALILAVSVASAIVSVARGVEPITPPAEASDASWLLNRPDGLPTESLRDATTLQPPWLRPFPEPGGPLAVAPGTPLPDELRATAGSAEAPGGWQVWRPAGASEGRRIRLQDRLRSAHVEVVRPDGGVRASDGWGAGRWAIGPHEWLWVGWNPSVPVNGKNEGCIWAHPTDEGAIRIRWDALPPADEVRLSWALSDVAASNPEKGELRLVVRMDGEEVLDRHHPQIRGFRSSVLKRKGATDGPLSLEIVVDSPTVAQRHFCFRGELVRRVKGGGDP